MEVVNKEENLMKNIEKNKLFLIFFLSLLIIAFLLISFFDLKGSGNATGPSAPSTIGLAPSGCQLLTTLEIINDQSIIRNNELAFSGIPIARSENLFNGDNLIVVDSAGNRVQAQFNSLSRWASGPNDLNSPIRWLQVAVKADVLANGKTEYDLRKCSTSQVVNNPNDVVITSSANIHTINTGVSTFVLNENVPSLFQSIKVNGNDVGYSNNNAGPVFIDGNGNSLTPYIGPLDNFEIEENGPVKVVVKTMGHFQRDLTNAVCGFDPGYTARFTFSRESSDVGIEFEVVNECGDGFTRPFTQNFPVREVAWNFPFNNVVEKISLSDNSVYHSTSSARISQNIGNQNNPSGWRRALLQNDGSTLENLEFFAKPMVGLRNNMVTATLQLAMMRYREPQALDSDGNILSLKFISEPKIIGEGQGNWHYAKLHLLPGNPTDLILQNKQNQGILEIERGLLIHTPINYLNSVNVMPSLPSSDTATPEMITYLNLLNNVHSSTINQGGQWDQTKNYDMFTWPDYQFDQWPASLNSPLSHSPKSNYWSASSSELKQWFVDGDPKWVWDFAWWQENQFLRTVNYNLGVRVGTLGSDYRSGFNVGTDGGAPSEGNRYRTAESSDDYGYNQGSDEAYIIRPSGGFKDAFWRGGTTFVNRYNVPQSQQAGRDFWLSALRIQRGVMQHVNALRYAAEFSPTDNLVFQNKLNEVMNEFVTDNLFGGIPCFDDFGNQNSCTTAQAFMLSALHLDVFREYLNNWGDINGMIRNTFSTYAQQLYQQVMTTQSDGSIIVGGNWQTGLNCNFNNGQLVNCVGVFPEAEPNYEHERAMEISTLLIAQELDPSINLCDVASAALPSALSLGGFQDYYTSGGGWFKGAAQGMRDIVHGIGIAEICSGVAVSQTCGNSLLEGTEQCDDGNLVSGDGCSSSCQIETPPQNCGNNIIDVGEVCDNSNLNTQTCQTQGFDSGSLRCATNCLNFDTSSCNSVPLIAELGDVTVAKDGIGIGINIQDVIMVVEHIVSINLFSTQNMFDTADVNCDGQVNVNDVLLMVDKVINPSTTLSCNSGTVPVNPIINPEMTFFVTSVGNDANGGNFGGLAGADTFCNTLAVAAGSTGKIWRAYLSSSLEDARNRIGTGPWNNFNGVQIASDIVSLHSNGVSSNLILDENGNSVSASTHDILTGSASDGTLKNDPECYGSGCTCSDWTDDGSLDSFGWVGHTDDIQWNDAHVTQGEVDSFGAFINAPCSQAGLALTAGSGKIYCFAK